MKRPVTSHRGRKRDESVAYHEAGHVVVAFWLRVGIGRKGVTIIPDDDSEGSMWTTKGFIGRPDEEPPPRVRCMIENKIIALLAGEHAQRKYSPSSVRSHHRESDLESAKGLLHLLSSNSAEFVLHYKLLDERAKNLVEVRWKEIVAVANALLKKKTLTRNEIREAILISV